VKIGDEARIGAASLVISDVPPMSVATGVPARVGLGFSGKGLKDLTDNKLPDPIADTFRFLSRQVETLEGRLAEIEKEQGIAMELNGSLEEKKRELRRIFSPFNEEYMSGAGI